MTGKRWSKTYRRRLARRRGWTKVFTGWGGRLVGFRGGDEPKD